MTSDPEILNTVGGATFEFTDIPPTKHFASHSKLDAKARSLLQAEIDTLLQKRVIVLSQPEGTEFVSPIFTVPNTDGSFRLILNLKVLNSFLQYIHFKMDNIRTVIFNVTPGCYMATLDLKSAYYSVPVSHDF